MPDEKKTSEAEESAALKRSMSFVVGKRLPLPKNWAGEDIEKLEFPPDLTNLTSTQLGELLGIWTSVMGYAQYEVARMDIERTARQNRYEFEKKSLYIKLSGPDSGSEEHKKSEVYVQTAKLLKEAEEAKAAYTLTNALLNVYSKYYQALSRELARRGIAGNEQEPSVPTGDSKDEDWVEDGKQQLTKQWGDKGE